MFNRFFLALLLFISTNSYAVSPEYQAVAEKLFAVAQMDTMMAKMQTQLSSMLDQQSSKANLNAEQRVITDKYHKRIKDLLLSEITWEKMKVPAIESYAKVFSIEDLNALITFYETPAGQKMVTKMPELMNEVMLLSQAMIKETLPKIEIITKEMIAELEQQKK